MVRLIAALALAMVLGVAALAPAGPALAQEGLFTPRLTVNGRTITEFEHFQRRLFLALLRTPGDIDQQAEVALIQDRLSQDAAQALGIELSDAQILAGMEEFASRANLGVEEFVTAINQGGVEAETFRDFVEAGLAWREVIRAHFGPRVQISDAEIDRALALSAQRGIPTRVLVSEMIIDMPANRIEETTALANRLSVSLRSEAAFAAAAREHSSAKSAADGGDLGWRSIADVPSAARAALEGLRPGQVSRPIAVGNKIGIFYLRDMKEAEEPSEVTEHVEYAEFLIPGAGTATAAEEAARITAKTDRCNDLYGVAAGLPEERLTITERPISQVPADVARELAGLDEGETSASISRGGAQVLVMLCARRSGPVIELPSREAMRSQLVNERLNALAEGYMADLMADALIRYP